MKEFAFIHEDGKLPPALDGVDFLKSFSVDQIDDILHSSNIVECEAGDTIVEEGKPSSRIYILLTGKLEVRKEGELLATFDKTGDIFGELGVVNKEARSASVVATTQSYCLAIDQEFLKEIKPEAQNPSYYAALYGFLARVLAGRLKATSRELAQVEKRLEETEERLKLAEEELGKLKAKKVGG